MEKPDRFLYEFTFDCVRIEEFRVYIFLVAYNDEHAKKMAIERLSEINPSFCQENPITLKMKVNSLQDTGVYEIISKES